MPPFQPIEQDAFNKEPKHLSLLLLNWAKFKTIVYVLFYCFEIFKNFIKLTVKQDSLRYKSNTLNSNIYITATLKIPIKMYCNRAKYPLLIKY